MTEDELIERWHLEKQSYEDWGAHLTAEILRELGAAGIDCSKFLKLVPTPRAKGDNSFLQKAFYRKQYADRWEGVEDKVGTRFVVLLSRDLEAVASAVERVSCAHSRRARDQDELEKSNPSAFDYSAIHYICRSNCDIPYQGRSIPAGLPCEVQIKTLLQHAWSEISHETVYKPELRASDRMKRDIAKSSALIEATNDYFERVKAEIEAKEAMIDSLTKDLTTIYQQNVGTAPEISDVEAQFLLALRPLVESLAISEPAEQVAEFLRQKPFVVGVVKENAPGQLAFRQPSIFLLFFLASRAHRDISNNNDLPQDLVSTVLTKLGRASL